MPELRMPVFVFVMACLALMAPFIIDLRRLRRAGAAALFEAERSSSLEQKLAEASEEIRRLNNWNSHLDKTAKWYREECGKKLKLVKSSYKILTVGVMRTGKTALTLKWVNPLIKLEMIEGTKIERYERLVSYVFDDDVLTFHTFQIGDWGGEHIVAAQHELTREEIHGLLLVVDLGRENATAVEPDRVQEQINEFRPQSLQYFFGPGTLTRCKTVMLFINKSDLIPGTPSEVEETAKRYFQPIIDSLIKYSPVVDICVLVGSAISGHNTHRLFAHFVEKILPPNAYSAELLQRMKRNGNGSRKTRGDEVQ